jgi:hypothetical protein
MRALLPLTAWLAACSSGGGFDKSDSSGGVDAPNTTEPTSSDTPADSGSPDALSPTWLDLSADIVLLYGIPDPAASEIRLTGRDAALTAVCGVTGPPTAFTPVDPPPNGVLAWWDIDLPVDSACLLPLQIRLGIGEYDALLDPFLSPAGVTGTPYGLYTEAPAGALWIFGVAGSPANYDGLEAPVDLPPLPDASYRADGLVLLPVSL